MKDTVVFVQGMLYKPAAATAGFFEDIVSIRTVYEENQVLRQTLTRYARDTMRLNELELQNKRLVEALSFTESQKQMNNYRFRIADVIAYNPDRLNHTIQINLGEKDGIKPNMAVVSVDGLAGRVVQVSSFYSTVQLLTGINDTAYIGDGSFIGSKAIAVTVKGKESSFGVIEKFDLDDTQTLIVTKIETTDPMEVGDTIITSGRGRIFPSGIEVGKVTSIEVGEFGITYKAAVEPFASFHHLREVFVVDVPELHADGVSE